MRGLGCPVRTTVSRPVVTIVLTTERTDAIKRDHARECVVRTGRRPSSLGRKPDLISRSGRSVRSWREGPTKTPLRESNRSRPIHGVSQQVNLTSFVDDDARRGHRQPVAPFAGENLGTGQKPLRQSDATRMVIARCGHCHHGQPLFARLKADIGPVKMTPELRIEPQTRATTHDQHDLVERRHACGELGTIAEDAATVVHPTN